MILGTFREFIGCMIGSFIILLLAVNDQLELAQAFGYTSIGLWLGYRFWGSKD